MYTRKGLFLLLGAVVLAGGALQIHILTADGGRPLPPLPPAKELRFLTADGGRPLPPIPPARQLGLLIADGGRPLPPSPPLRAGLVA
jgi:hypothetical protein